MATRDDAAAPPRRAAPGTGRSGPTLRAASAAGLSAAPRPQPAPAAPRPRPSAGPPPAGGPSGAFPGRRSWPDAGKALIFLFVVLNLV